jgi:hypothetical protein
MRRVQRIKQSRGRAVMCAALLSILLVLGAALTGCGDGRTTGTPTTSTADVSQETSVSTTQTTESATTVSSVTTGTVVAVSPASIAYAEELGGTSQLGKTLYFVIGASVESEEEAQTLLDEATPYFGDMQSYFIVQRSDNFEGMEPGWWVVFEAYRDEPSTENLDFGRRAFPDAYVKSATVLTSDPIPVYEDRLGL